MNPIVPLVLGTGALQIGFAAYMLSRRDLEDSRRILAFAMAATIPGLGPALAVLAVALRGTGSSPALRQPVSQAAPDREEYARVGSDQAPVLYRLAGSREERLAALSGLARDESPAALSALRWIIERGNPDAVVDAALTLEQLNDSLISEVAAARKLFAEAAPGDLIRHGDRIARMIESGLSDPSMAAQLAGMARDFYLAAEHRGGAVPGQVAARWARLELRAMHPEAALAVLDRYPPVAGDDRDFVIEITRIRRDAVFAARAEHGASMV